MWFLSLVLPTFFLQFSFSPCPSSMFLLSLATSVTFVLHVCPWPLLEHFSDHIAGIVADAVLVLRWLLISNHCCFTSVPLVLPNVSKPALIT